MRGLLMIIATTSLSLAGHLSSIATLVPQQTRQVAVYHPQPMPWTTAINYLSCDGVAKRDVVISERRLAPAARLTNLQSILELHRLDHVRTKFSLAHWEPIALGT